MELIIGVNLSHLLYRCGPLPVSEACELIRQAALGLQSAYEHGLVHRDVKPSNLMLSTSGQVKLLDLGLALLRDIVPTAGDLTGVGEVMGTAEYMAPEQWAETHTVDIRTDIYSLGCTLYALLMGDPPFTRTGRRSFERMMAAHQEEPVPPLTDRRSDAPAALCELLNRMLAKNPADRPATPGEVADALESLAVGANLSALFSAAAPGVRTSADRPRPGGTPTPTPTPVSTAPVYVRARRRRRVLVAALLVLLGAGVAAYALAPAPVPKGSDTTMPENDTPEPNDPKGWRNLLTQRHDEKRLRRKWPAGSDLVPDPAKGTLLINTTAEALVRLGDAPNPAYKLLIGLRQARWPGGIGVYFGGRTEAPPNKFVFQYLTLVHTNAGKGREYALQRFGGRYSLELNAKPGIAAQGIHQDYVPPPGNGEMLLELEIKPGGLDTVRWDGKVCSKVVGADALAAVLKEFPDGGLTGEFGIFCNGATVRVTTARYIPTE
jgi:hypothetical protein